MVHFMTTILGLNACNIHRLDRMGFLYLYFILSSIGVSLVVFRICVACSTSVVRNVFGIDVEGCKLECFQPHTTPFQ